MSNYTKSTNFASKDSLPSGDANKIVKGTEINTEFDNIATAVATKADINSPTFTGTVSAPTPALSGTGTLVATVAAIQALYPVGSIYMNATNSTNPGTLLGFGTWVAFGAGRVPVGFDASNSMFDSAEETGGSYDATLPSHTHTYSGTSSGQSASHSHTITSTASAHSHSMYIPNSSYVINIASVTNSSTGTTTSSGGYSVGGLMSSETVSVSSSAGNASADHTHTYSGTTASSGSSATNANVQPYITVYMWKRTV